MAIWDDLPVVRLGLCGGVVVEANGRRLPEAMLSGRQGRLVLAYLVCERHRTVPREELADLVWGERLPSSWASSLAAVVSRLRRLLTEAGLDGPAVLASSFGAYRLHLPGDVEVDLEEAAGALARSEDALAQGDAQTALDCATTSFDIARRGFLTDDCPWVDAQRERLRDLHVRALQAGARAQLGLRDTAKAVELARRAMELDDLRESGYRLLMQALDAAGERGEALRTWERCREMLVEELGSDPSPETEAVYLQLLGGTEIRTAPAPAAADDGGLPTGVVTFVLSDIVSSSSLWERAPEAMAEAVEHHDHLVADTVAAHGGVLLKAKLEGDATVSVFRRASAAAEAALAVQRAVAAGPWPEGASLRVRIAMHAGEAFERDGDYFGPALNRAARLRSLAGPGQVLVSQTLADVVHDHLPAGVILRSLGEHSLRGLSRGEHVFELVEAALLDDPGDADTWVHSPPLPGVLAGRGVFVGRARELDRLGLEWASAAAGTTHVTLVAGEPGVGKTRLAAEWARRVKEEGALVLYGRCDEELGAPYQPFAEILRALIPCVELSRLRAVRGIEELARLAPELSGLLTGLSAPSQADPDTERSLLFDSLVRVLATVSEETPVLLVIDDLHWAAKPTLLLLRHLLRSGDGTRMQIVSTYRSTDLDRTHPLSATLADLARDGPTERLSLSGLGSDEVSAYLAAAGYHDAALGEALSAVTSGNPFFLIEVLRNVEEGGGRWDANTLPQGVREAVGRRLSRLSDEANEALLVGAVVGSHFSVDLIEAVLERDLVDPIDECRRAGLVVEEPGNAFRFHHALVRQSLLAEVASVKRVRLHQRIAAALEAGGPQVVDAHLADLSRHWFECAFAGGAAKAVDYSRRAADEAMARLAYEEAAELYERAVQAVEVEADGGDDERRAELLRSRCEALLAAADPSPAAKTIEALRQAARGRSDLEAWATCYAGEVAVLTRPELLEATADSCAEAARDFAGIGDPDGEAASLTVRATCLARTGHMAECEASLDLALTAARRADSVRRVNAVLAGAPTAALWGPSPVSRSSGRCLDVIRVLRITTGSSAVEAVALRCQAVLEALRGRGDSAHRLLSAARRILESLGHTYGLLEADVASGLIELYAGASADAATELRRAYDGFVARGVDVNAALAAALLARTALAAGNFAEALALSEDAEGRAGADLQAGIAWRAVRAEALAAAGRIKEALDVARQAVAQADPTDALLDQADAHLALARVLEAAGSEYESRQELALAIERYERKGATARAETIRATGPTPKAIEVRPEITTNVGRGRRAHLNDSFARLIAHMVGPLDEVQRKLADVLSPDAVMEDHVMHLALFGEEILATVADIASVRDMRNRYEALATLGARHGLLKGELTGREGLTSLGFLVVACLDDQGRMVRAERFAEDALGEALARLIELHGEDEMAPEQRAGRLRLASGFRRGSNTVTDDVVVIDHRPVALGTLTGRDALLQAGFALDDLTLGHTRTFRDILGLTEQFALGEFVTEGRTDDGGQFEIPLLALAHIDDDGRMARLEWFAPEQLDAALARFDELTGDEAPVGDVTENDAVRYIRWAWEIVAGGRTPAGASYLADDAVFEDRRPLVGGYRFRGRDEVERTTVRSLARAGAQAVVIEPIATRGQRLALVQVVAGVHDLGEVEFIGLVEIDDNGLGKAFVLWEPNDIDAAFEELDAHFAAGEARRAETTWSLLRRIPAGLRHRDYLSQTAEIFSPGFEWVDHRPVGHGTIGWLQSADSLRVFADLSRDFRVTYEAIHRVEPWGALGRLKAGGHNHEDGEVELAVWFVVAVSAERISRLEWFDGGDFVSALNRFEELRPAATEAGALPSNAAWRFVNDLQERLLAGDWSWLAANSSDDVVVDDQRSIVAHRADGRAAVLGFSQAMHEVGVSYANTALVATRGERLVLYRICVGGSSGEIEALATTEVDELGRFRGGSAFDPDDLDAAYEDLDDRFAAGEAKDSAEMWSLLRGVGRAYINRDLTQLSKLFSAGLEWVDHRPMGWGTIGSDEAGQLVRGLAGLSPDIRCTYLEIVRIEPWGAVFQLMVSGHANSGGEFEIPSLVVTTMARGQIDRIEYFSIEDRATALERFEELRPQALGDLPPTNTAARQVVKLHEHVLDEDVTFLDSLLSEHVVGDDARAIVGTRAEGRAEVLRQWASVRDIGVSDVTATPVATRGDRLVLCRCLYGGAGGEVEIHAVIETDDKGLIIRGKTFDPHDLEAAYDELDGWYFAGEGASLAGAFSRWTRMASAYRARDWSAMDDCHTGDFEFLDHRPVGWGTTDWDGYVRTIKAMADLAGDVWFRIVEIYRISLAGLVARVRGGGHDGEGGEWSLEWTGLVTLDGDLIRRIEYFPLEDRDAALARFTELTGGALRRFEVNPTEAHPTAVDDQTHPVDARIPVLEAIQALATAYNARDWDGLGAVLAEQCTVFDERPTGWGVIDKAGFLARARELATMAPDALLACVAVHSLSDGGAVCTYEVTGTVPGGGEFTIVFETTGLVDHGRIVELHLLPEGHVEEAERRLAGTDR